MKQTYTKTFLTLVLFITFFTVSFNFTKAQVAPTATLTRWVVGHVNLMALEFNGVGRELYIEWNGQETFYHNDVDTEYSIIRTTVANRTTAVINLDGSDIVPIEAISRTRCLVYNSNHRYYLVVFAGGEDTLITYGDEQIRITGIHTYQTMRNYAAILEADVGGFTHDCEHLINPEIVELLFTLFVPIVLN